MKVWIVEHGEYSDRHVVAVTDSSDGAEKIAALGSSGTATQYELNEIADRLLQGFRRWRVTFRLSTDKCLEAVLDFSEYDLQPREAIVTSFPNAPSNGQPVLEFYVDARDKAEAIKIASERRRGVVVRSVE